IIKRSSTGPATNIISGLAVGMESTVFPTILLAGGIIISYSLAGLYGVAIAAAGMMATTAMQLAIDAFGPIADNAGGIAEMCELPKEVRERTDILDAVGNTTAATGKGFAIASAALTSLALFAAFVGVAGIDSIDLYKAPVLASLFVGAMIPFIFSSLAIASVGRAAMDMVNEVRRQFKEIPGIMEYKAKPEYERCVEISTKASIREMLLPGLIALIAPLLIGFGFLGVFKETSSAEMLGGLLAGVTVSGVLMGMFQNNAGGAWDNAKKSFEKGVEINGQIYYKKSEPHKASVTGDTVGDPFKDTSGPSMNILIKLMSIVSLVIAPYIAVKEHTKNVQTARKIEEKKVEVVATTSVEPLVFEDYDNEVATKFIFSPDSKLTEEDYVWLDGIIAKMQIDSDVSLTFEATTNQPLAFDQKEREKKLKEYFQKKGVDPSRVSLKILKSDVDAKEKEQKLALKLVQ
ncbi:MAG: sodium/proton-translocating pyrophosphatase, partial [Flammeovirgaceae bacterium]|nr:sodium/proton-translocating pyrophosphatase [Flammeovirgaceae bacterium]MDW8286865.1 sodium/proton-translocating pyrophosphatase [Flammeovirgaceae bacterium]